MRHRSKVDQIHDNENTNWFLRWPYYLTHKTVLREVITNKLTTRKNAAKSSLKCLCIFRFSTTWKGGSGWDDDLGRFFLPCALFPRHTTSSLPPSSPLTLSSHLQCFGYCFNIWSTLSVTLKWNNLVLQSTRDNVFAVANVAPLQFFSTG